MTVARRTIRGDPHVRRSRGPVRGQLQPSPCRRPCEATRARGRRPPPATNARAAPRRCDRASGARGGRVVVAESTTDARDARVRDAGRARSRPRGLVAPWPTAGPAACAPARRPPARPRDRRDAPFLPARGSCSGGGPERAVSGGLPAHPRDPTTGRTPRSGGPVGLHRASAGRACVLARPAPGCAVSTRRPRAAREAARRALAGPADSVRAWRPRRPREPGGPAGRRGPRGSVQRQVPGGRLQPGGPSRACSDRSSRSAPTRPRRRLPQRAPAAPVAPTAPTLPRDRRGRCVARRRARARRGSHVKSVTRARSAELERLHVERPAHVVYAPVPPRTANVRATPRTTPPAVIEPGGKADVETRSTDPRAAPWTASTGCRSRARSGRSASASARRSVAAREAKVARRRPAAPTSTDCWDESVEMNRTSARPPRRARAPRSGRRDGKRDPDDRTRDLHPCPAEPTPSSPSTRGEPNGHAR